MQEANGLTPATADEVRELKEHDRHQALEASQQEATDGSSYRQHNIKNGKTGALTGPCRQGALHTNE